MLAFVPASSMIGTGLPINQAKIRGIESMDHLV
jgi:hypothetical protein